MSNEDSTKTVRVTPDHYRLVSRIATIERRGLGTQLAILIEEGAAATGYTDLRDELRDELGLAPD